MRLDFRKLDLRLIINSQHLKLIRLRGGYRSWTLEYSHGLTVKDGKSVSLLHFPAFHHVDMRYLT